MRIFIAEDEALVAMMLEEILEELGHTVAASSADLDDSLRVAATGEFDLAIVDINLNGRESFEVAKLIASRGIPTCFASGYGSRDVPFDYAGFPMLGKPYVMADVRAMITQLRP